MWFPCFSALQNSIVLKYWLVFLHLVIFMLDSACSNVIIFKFVLTNHCLYHIWILSRRISRDSEKLLGSWVTCGHVTLHVQTGSQHLKGKLIFPERIAQKNVVKWSDGTHQLQVQDDCWSFPGNIPAWPTALQIAHVLGTTRKVSFTVQMIGNFPNSNSALERTSPVKWRPKTSMEKPWLVELSLEWQRVRGWPSLYFVSFFGYGRTDFHPAVGYWALLCFIISQQILFFQRHACINTRDGVSSIRIIPWEEFEGTFWGFCFHLFVFKGISCTPDWSRIHSV